MLLLLPTRPCLALLPLLSVASLFAAPRFDLSTPGKIVRVADPQISPDGKSIVVLISRANFNQNRYDGTLTLVDPATKASRPLTRDRRGVSSPRWSPAGDQLAFLAPPAPGARPQIFVMPMNGGGDAWQVTKSPTGVQQFSWGPNGWLAYAAEDERPKKTGEERFNDSFEVGHSDFLMKEAPMPVHLWVVNSDLAAPARKLTSGSWTLPIVLPPSSPASPPVWSPDGKSIAIVKVAGPHTGDANKASLQIVDVATGAMRGVTGRTSDESQPIFSPDGTKLAFWSPRDRQSKNVNEIHIVDAKGGDAVSITRGLDRNIVRAIWMPDGKSLLVGGNDHTSTGLWLQPVTGAAAKKLTIGRTISGSFWVDVSVANTGAMAFTASDSARPAELYYMPSADAAPQRLTDLNAEVAAMDLGKAETVTWDAPDGFKADGVVTYPPGFDPAKKYPLVLYIHGGPRSASKQAFSPRAQLMAAKGWVIFEPNYRGSDNLGNAYQSAIWNDAGAGPGRDVMAGVDLLKKRGFVDESRMAVSGWSYGGYMTTWLLGNYPNVWKAAVAGAAVTDWLHQYDLGDANVRRGSAFGGSPYTGNRMQAYIDQSPITYAPKIKAPTLVLSNTGDYRVPVTQSYRLFRALEDNGVPTKFIAYPIGGHSPSDPVRMRDVDRRWIAWLGHYLDGSEASPSPSVGN
ncbi:peptidase [Bryobacterales bacterium F-183]|nr:peptidase [Bryobacterales bacterium F-183]